MSRAISSLLIECFSDVKPFGIPLPIINNRVGALGTLVKVQELVKVYDNGEMDVRIKEVAVFRIFDIAHQAGLSVEEEHELLGLTQEIHRQEYLNRHLNTIISVLKETETLKEKIKLNGRFKNDRFDGLISLWLHFASNLGFPSSNFACHWGSTNHLYLFGSCYLDCCTADG